MTDRPFRFSAPMVRAILREIEQSGTGKTQTRRTKGLPAIDEQANGLWHIHNRHGGFANVATADIGSVAADMVRIQPGDRLWVREAWRVSRKWDVTKPSKLPAHTMTVMFEAGGCISNIDRVGDWRPDGSYDPSSPPSWAGKLRPSMFLPRWASRLTLYVTEVRVERLQDISEADSIAEGIHRIECVPSGRSEFQIYDPSTNGRTSSAPVESYRSLWELIYGLGAWEANPWVVAYSFVPRLSNIADAPASLQEAA